MKIQPVTQEFLAPSVALVTAAFATAPHTDGNEGPLVAALRRSATYRPEYDAVALADDGTLIGHTMLSEASVGDAKLFVLAPLAVAPAFQHQGVGSALIAFLEATAGEDLRRAISILGDPAYYGRFGYGPAAKFGITAPFAVADENFMIRELIPGGLSGVHGTLRYDPAFGL
ncbi:GNAT family N-acetyltransferase [Lacticaseibacillus kribbianus]|uniref:GNAT family N-acetyltransferase n=1 Tax=Lacticaseibacillus kribbianus TaxID=2926292 RepID=UPI001CD6B975|nr:N-acetyltransferase [Lacticaseibacillus kribbianus]